MALEVDQEMRPLGVGLNGPLKVALGRGPRAGSVGAVPDAPDHGGAPVGLGQPPDTSPCCILFSYQPRNYPVASYKRIRSKSS